MPELPEVETLARDLQPLLRGASFSSVDVRWPRSVAMPTESEFIARLPGRGIEHVGRRAKFLVFFLSGSSRLLIHLRMSGQLRVEPEEFSPGKHARVVFHLTDGRQLIFDNPRKLGRVYLTSDLDTVLGHLGPEPLAADFTLDVFATALSRRTGALKPLLLNQSFLAGLGNVYADEVLFEARLHPLRKADSLSSEDAERLHAAIRRVLRQAIEDRGTTLDDGGYRDTEGQPGRHQHRLQVYHRTDEPCLRCSKPIERSVVGGRGTHFCPHCQH